MPSITQAVNLTRVAQSPGGNRIVSIGKSAALGGVLGAAAGAVLSQVSLPFLPGFGAAVGAAVGGAAGIVLGGIVGFLRSRGGSDGAHVGALTLQSPPPPPVSTPSGLPPAPPVERASKPRHAHA